MSFDRQGLIDTCRAHGTVARVVVARVRGSAPRDVGAAMLVWSGGFSGTIGGGTLEHEALRAARRMTEPGQRQLSTHALGPDLGQCCGGSVDLLSTVYDHAAALALPEDLIFSGDGDMPLPVARLKAQARNAGQVSKPRFLSGWMIEPVTTPDRQIWIWGAGHVGRALVQVLAPLPQIGITWVDTLPERFPERIPDGVDRLVAQDPSAVVRFAPPTAEHLIVTYSHDIDLDLCHRLLGHGFGFAGLIGSATKWARFRSRLRDLGHAPASIARIACPIGDPALGKHPHAIAIGVGASLLRPALRRETMEDTA